MNPKVDAFIARAKQWSDEMTRLRKTLLACGLQEDLKWGKPCYGHESRNIAILQPMKHFLSLMFFEGALLDDPKGVLGEQGPNSRSAKRITFTSIAQVTRLTPAVKALVRQAVEIEREGLVVAPVPAWVPVEELRARFAHDPKLEAAFAALTPGRQREYHLHFAGAKQAATRVARIDKCAPRILEGKGRRD